MELDDVKSALDLINALAWPLVVVLALILFRGPLVELLGEVIRRARKVSVYHVSVELATVPVLSPSWSPPEIDVRQLSSAHLIDSYTVTLFDELSKPAPADCAIVDLGSGKEWLSSRLFLFALVLGEVTGVRAFVFLEKSSSTRKAFLGIASPKAVWKALAARHPWFEVEFGGATAKLGNAMFPTSNSATLRHIAKNYVETLQRKTEPPKGEERDYQQWESTSPTNPTVSEKVWEKTTWITGELLERWLGPTLSDAWCTEEQDTPNSALVEAILKRNDDFVAIVDRHHKFRGLVDRKALASQAWRTRVQDRSESTRAFSSPG
ncbi:MULTISPECIES: hypothetical protein [unclassified Bradyrhizobium]|uniref:hypothetical protein n=1 Tax=unclassified Bradyrhizobium TaxID=2631580 RepID=UPI002FF22D3A